MARNDKDGSAPARSTKEVRAARWLGTGIPTLAMLSSALARRAAKGGTDRGAAIAAPAVVSALSLTEMAGALSLRLDAMAVASGALESIDYRSDFARDLLQALPAGADALTPADLDEVTARAIAARTRTDLATARLALLMGQEHEILRRLGVA